jgi:hypothetical protein
MLGDAVLEGGGVGRDSSSYERPVARSRDWRAIRDEPAYGTINDLWLGRGGRVPASTLAGAGCLSGSVC